MVVVLVSALAGGCSEDSDGCGSHGTARETAQTAHGWAGVVRQELVWVVFGGGYEMRATLWSEVRMTSDIWAQVLEVQAGVSALR